ncbi:MAG: hypothetical protein Q9182_006307 [Xanthomendoza sp. 2 TL-2023]
MPAWLAQNNYQNPTDISHTPFHRAYGTAEELFAFLTRRPQYSEPFHLWMTAFDEGRTSWLTFYPVIKLQYGARKDSDAVLFLDIGGGMGHEASALKKRFPSLPGKLVVQDLPVVVARIQSGVVKSMAHNFFEEQPVKGARAYYFRNVLHNWGDAECVKILRATRVAMDPSYSKLLINQWVVPEKGASSFMTHQDLNMMAMFAAMERTERQWHALLGEAGFKIEGIWRSADAASECLIEAVRSDWNGN